MKPSNILIGTICGLLSFEIYAGSIITEVPSNPDPSDKYIFYMHGSVEESEGSTEKYKTAIEAIAESSATIISEVRDNPDPNTYAQRLKAQVNQLISKGVPPESITISGFSKGSIIALASAGIINNTKINYVLLAGCSSFLNEKYSVDPAKAVGRILSIYDSGDEKFESCHGIIKASDKLKFDEIELDSGKGHKVFRIPKDKFIKQWRDPLIDWADA
ncbi:MAG: alpha/beta hydrolase [Gammaproteobacteria bacterium]|nr:alpha/beta hydrolase [Gammaproteobacteria bacterium]